MGEDSNIGNTWNIVHILTNVTRAVNSLSLSTAITGNPGDWNFHVNPRLYTCLMLCKINLL